MLLKRVDGDAVKVVVVNAPVALGPFHLDMKICDSTLANDLLHVV